MVLNVQAIVEEKAQNDNETNQVVVTSFFSILEPI